MRLSLLISALCAGNVLLAQNTFPATGNVGIGTTNPTEQLEITGNLKLPAATVTSGIIYQGPNRLLHAYGTDNVFMGRNSGNFTFTGIGQNIAIGFNTLSALTTGNNNTAVGFRACQSMTTGTYNTALGEQALLANTTGAVNTALGPEALYANTTGSRNVAIGSGALYANTTGSDNVAVGRNCLVAANSSGSDANVAMGNQAGNAMTSGGRNVLIGTFAGPRNKTGMGNIFIGHFAAQGTANNSHDENTAIGEKIFFTISTGSRNIGLGNQAGASLASGSNNIVIGYKTDVPSPSASNFLTIGNVIFASGGFGEGTAIGTGNVGIGTNSPGAKLDVNGQIRIQGGSPGAGKILTSDASGVASWSAEADPKVAVSTTNKIPKWNGTALSDGLMTDNGTAIGIGTASPHPDAKLSVNGNIYGRKLKVTQDGWPDFVFESGYKLRPLSEVETYVLKYKHLPDMPAATEVETNGLDVGNMNSLLLQKVEELTLYLIELKKTNDQLNAENQAIKKRLEALEKEDSN